MRRFTSFDGIQIAYQEWTPDAEAAGGLPPVVLHHGFVADANLNWVGPGVVEALVAAGRRVVALDARGHGASDKPRDPARYGEAAMARDLRLLLEVIGADRVDLVGYSMGAVVALEVAAGGDEAAARVRRLVVGGVGAAVVELGGVDTRVVPRAALAEALLAGDPASITDSQAARFRLLADTVGADREALAAEVMAAHPEAIALDRIAVPTLVLAGRDDPLARRPEVLAAAIRGATLRLVDGDHLSAVVAADFAPAIVAFLAQP